MKMNEGHQEKVVQLSRKLLATNREIARLNIVIDVQQRQIRQLISEKADLLSEINALYRTGGHE